jgi:hypothetical protein
MTIIFGTESVKTLHKICMYTILFATKKKSCIEKVVFYKKVLL